MRPDASCLYLVWILSHLTQNYLEKKGHCTYPRTICLFVSFVFRQMEYPVKKDDRTPHRGGQAQLENLQNVLSSKKKLTPDGQESSSGSQPPGPSPSSRARVLSPPGSSSNLEFTKRTMIEAQAFRTSVRVGESNREANRNDAMSNDREERAPT
jgi:hypothetical protein